MVSYAMAGDNVTLYLTQVDPNHVNKGCLLSAADKPCPQASSFLAQVVTFDLKYPLTSGSAVSSLNVAILQC